MRKQISNKRLITVLVVFVSICICVGIVYEINFLVDQEEVHGSYPAFVNTSDSSTNYEINSETILSSLNHGETNVFKHSVATPEDYTPLVAGSFPWTQSDYLRIASALGQIEMNENLNDWQVLGMMFEKECSDNLNGFDSGSIIYFRFDNDNGTPDYLHYQTQTIAIYPLFKTVDVGRNQFPRPLLGWRSINLNSLKVNAEEALQIAEEKGGEKVRLKSNNKCKISVYNGPVSEHNEWKVLYWGWFEIHIDPYSGEYKIIGKNDKLE